eukprot:CAMPEP_0182559424 /NCGR_PEP_ID=MMETSP1324-20130603/2554_1 /TAXON_ID=236786 /ORGANISM="Florenciella sp., Strain RCC1587" /LENGTH=109 /DNA_ID=CAMNT_0024771683 /DNA_START=141 /DNA_END=471 /DNA_ORIENTATION=-
MTETKGSFGLWLVPNGGPVPFATAPWGVAYTLCEWALQDAVVGVRLDELPRHIYPEQWEEEPEAIREADEDEHLAYCQVLVPPIHNEAQEVNTCSIELLVKGEQPDHAQ